MARIWGKIAFLFKVVPFDGHCKQRFKKATRRGSTPFTDHERHTLKNGEGGSGVSPRASKQVRSSLSFSFLPFHLGTRPREKTWLAGFFLPSSFFPIFPIFSPSSLSHLLRFPFQKGNLTSSSFALFLVFFRCKSSCRGLSTWSRATLMTCSCCCPVGDGFGSCRCCRCCCCCRPLGWCQCRRRPPGGPRGERAARTSGGF